MCGIHLIWGKGANQESIQTLVDSNTHRGPDQRAVFSPWHELWIGVNRLKILHPGADADQPFWAPDGNSLLIWNGEIYNFKELKSILSKMGVEFTTESDTEVLLHYLKFFGTDGLAKLNGMFAIIYVNLIQKSVLVARDRNGEKPLHYFQTPETFILSSESRGIAKLTRPEIDPVQLAPYFYFRSAQPGKTFFKGIREWKPSRYSTIFRHSTFRWDNIPLPKKISSHPSLPLFQEILQDTVCRQFHADVPLGVTLSGGSDSSLLYSTWYQKTGIPLPCYTIEVEKKYRFKYQDADYAKRLVKQIPAKQELIYVDQTIFLKNWEKYLETLDQPIGDSASFLTWMIAAEAKKEVKVLVSGAGADELWGGYQRHRAFDQYLRYKNFWVNWAGLFGKLPLGREWKKMMAGIHPNPQKTFLNFSAVENPDSELMEDYARIFNPKLPELKQMLDFDRQVYLVQDVLKIQDNALMAQGIEGRSPYLDAKMLGLWKAVEDPKLLLGKPWIKASLEDQGLDWIAKRKKFGFGLPLLEWLMEGGPVAKKIFSNLKEFGKTSGYHLPESGKALCQNPEKHLKSHFLTLYNLFLLAEWWKLHKP